MKVNFHVASYVLGDREGEVDFDFTMEVPPEHEKNFKKFIKGMNDYEELDINIVSEEKKIEDSESFQKKE